MTGAPTCTKCSNVCFVWLRVQEPSRENRSQLSESSPGGSNRRLLERAHPLFIDEGDGLTSESEGVCPT